MDTAGVRCKEDTSDYEDLASRNVELEKSLAERNLRIQEMETQVSVYNEKLVVQKLCVYTRDFEEATLKNKFQLACEARDEFKFRVVELEKEVAKLKKENEVRNQPTTKTFSEVRALEALVASHEDQIAKYQEKLKAQEKINKELQKDVSILQTSTCSNQDSYARKIIIPQTDVNETAKCKVELPEKEQKIYRELEECKNELMEAAGTLQQERENTEAMKKNYEQEKENLKRELQATTESHRKLQKDYEKLCNELLSLKQQSLEPEEIIKTKAKIKRKQKTQDKTISSEIEDKEKPDRIIEISKEPHPEVESRRQLRPRQKKILYSASSKQEEIGVQQQKKSKRCP